MRGHTLKDLRETFNTRCIECGVNEYGRGFKSRRLNQNYPFSSVFCPKTGFFYAALIISVLLSALSLAVDAFAVSVCDGMTFRNLTKPKAEPIIVLRVKPKKSASMLVATPCTSTFAYEMSVCDGMTFRNLTKPKAATIPLTFGIFQAVMPISRALKWQKSVAA